MEDVDDIMLVEANVDNVMDNMEKLGDKMLGGDGPIVPKVGIKFKDENEIFEFYRRHAYELGFPIRKRDSKKDDDGVLK